jgi:hypothetical protein
MADYRAYLSCLLDVGAPESSAPSGGDKDA